MYFDHVFANPRDDAMVEKIMRLSAVWWLLAIRARVALLFGLIIAFSPEVGIVMVAWIIGVSSILTGIGLKVIALRWKNLGTEIEPLEATSESLHEAN